MMGHIGMGGGIKKRSYSGKMIAVHGWQTGTDRMDEEGNRITHSTMNKERRKLC